MIRDLGLVLAMELRMVLRQPMTLALLFVFPGLLGPGLLWLATWYTDTLGLSPAGRSPTVVERTVAVPDEVRDWIVEADHLVPVDPSAPADASLRLRGTTATIEHGLAPSEEQAAARLAEVVARHEREITEAVLRSAGIEGPLLTVRERDVNGAGLGALAGLVPNALLITVLMSAVFVAIDVFTGERERGTLETLWSSRADRRAVILGKYLLVVGEGAASGLVWLAWLALGGALGLVALPGFDAGVWAGLAVCAAASACEVAGVAVLVATSVPTYRAASFLVVPVMLGVTALGAIAVLPVDLGLAVAFVPLGNLMAAARDGLVGNTTPLGLLATAAGTATHVALATGAAGWMLSREGAVFAPEDTAALRRAGFHGRDAAALFVTELGLLWFAGQVAQQADLVWGMVFTQVVLFAGGALAWVAWLGVRPRTTLSLAVPGWRNTALAVLAGLSMPAVGMTVLHLQDPFLPAPGRLVEALDQLRLPDASSLVPVLVFAVLPGVCEELLFRGALLGFLRNSLRPVPRVLLDGALFGALHLSVHRFLPTGVLGLLLAAITVRSGSIVPAMIVHVLNNAIALTLLGDLPETAFPWWLTAPVAAVAIGCVAALRPREVGPATG